MKHLLLAFAISLSFIIQVSGQNNSSVKIEDKGELSLGIRNVNFFKNDEYYSPVIEGYTLVGYFFQPTIIYTPNKKLQITAGVHLLDYAGTKGFTTVKPVFSTRYSFSENTSLTIGTLNGSDRHQMFDPHFDLERAYSSYSEDGFQFLSEGDNYFNDTWISWEHFIFKGDTTREIFTLGQSFRFKTPVFRSIFSVEFPVQLQAKHKGGQISNYDEEVETYLNLAAGPKLNFDISEQRFGTISIECLRFVYKQVPSEPFAMNSGYGDWYRVHYNYKILSIMEGYWKSHDFYAPNGNGIYSSVSDYQTDVIVPDRKILTTSIYLTSNPVEGLELFFGVDLYYDIIRKKMDNSMAIHLSVDRLIHLLEVK
jgi:hypothetical protein